MEIKEKIKLQQWAEEIAQQQSSGLSHKQWCHIHNIPVSTFEYHCRRVRAAIQKMSEEKQCSEYAADTASLPEPSFAKIELTKKCIPESTKGGIHISMGDIRINILPDSHVEHIKLVMEMITHVKQC